MPPPAYNDVIYIDDSEDDVNNELMEGKIGLLIYTVEHFFNRVTNYFNRGLTRVNLV